MSSVGIGLVSAVFFGLSNVLARKGMAGRPHDNGTFMTVLINTLLLGTIVLGLGVTGHLPALPLQVVAVFALAGAFGTWAGRALALAATRALGPSRAAAYKVTSPVFAALAGILVLAEVPTGWQLAGGCVCLVGILVLSRHHPRLAAEPAAAQAADPPAAQRDGFGLGVLLAMGSAACFGTGFVVRRLGLHMYPDPVLGAWVGAATSLCLIMAGNLVRRDWPKLMDDNVRHVPVWFVLSGVASSLGLFFQFTALRVMQASIVGVLLGTEAIWTMVLSLLVLRREERLSARTVMAILLTAAGVALMTLGR